MCFLYNVFGEVMRTVKEEVVNEIIINKSRFITIIMPLFDKSLVKNNIDEIKIKYKDATHYCFGYIIGSFEKAFDDGEPSGTAGMPILNVLKTNNLTDVLCVVVRYFGGIKLGAGGLVRAYSSSASEALSKCDFGTIINGYEVSIKFDYSESKNIDFILNGIKVSKDFGEKVIYTFDIYDEAILETLKNYSTIICKKNKKMIKDED